MAFDARRLDDAWRRYTSKAAELHPPFTGWLADGASAGVIAATEKAIGCELPPELRHLLSLHNGSEGYQALPGWELFSSERIADEWKIWEDLYRTQFKPERVRCDPTGPVRDDEWWRLRWIPFTGDGGGNHLCVDMDPAVGGTKGQVITMWHDDPSRPFIAKSLTDFIDIIATDLETGALVWDEDWGSFREPDEED
jgi:cell wall assembly regulator SMI1